MISYTYALMKQSQLFPCCHAHSLNASNASTTDFTPLAPFKPYTKKEITLQITKSRGKKAQNTSKYFFMVFF